MITAKLVMYFFFMKFKHLWCFTEIKQTTTTKTYKPFTLNIFQQILWCWMENEFNRILLFCCNISVVQQYYSWC